MIQKSTLAAARRPPVWLQKLRPRSSKNRTKYGSMWTYFDGSRLHTTGRDCIPGRACDLCDKRTSAQSALWYQSRAEARVAANLAVKHRLGQIRGWERSKSVLVQDSASARDRIRYRPDFSVWETSSPAFERPDYRIEVKGSRDSIAPAGLLKIRLYRAAVARGEQPPLRIMNGDCEEIIV